MAVLFVQRFLEQGRRGERMHALDHFYLLEGFEGGYWQMVYWDYGGCLALMLALLKYRVLV